MAKRNRDMCKGPLFGNIVAYTIPVILTGILQLLFNAADLMIVGRMCGSIYVSAVGATTSLIHLITNLFIGLSVGAGVAVAHAIGAGEHKTVSRTVHTAIPTAIVSGVILTVIGIVFSGKFLTMMGTPEDVLSLSTTYMRIYFVGITASMLYNFGAAILRAAGDTKGPLVYLTLAGVVNVVLNIVFVALFDMTVDGVAWATTISQVLSAVLVVRALMLRQDACRLKLKSMRFYKAPLLKLLKIGVPAGIQGSLFSISNVIIQSSINSFGAVVVAGNSAASTIEGFVYTIMNSFHQTALNFTGQNVGAKQYKRTKKILLICLGCVFVAGGISGSLFYLFGRPLLSIFISDSAAAIEYGIIRMTFICLPYFVCGLMDVTTGAIRGMGVSITPMIITILGVCGLRIVWIYTIFQIPAYHTLSCLYFSYLVSWIVTFLVELVAFFVIYRRRIKKAAFLSESSLLN